MKKIQLVMLAYIISGAVFLGVRAGETPSTMSIKRTEDPIEVQGKSLEALIGVPISGMRLLVWKNGSFRPAPYQIDERDQNGEWVFTIGEEKSTDVDGGKLDDNDELAFMAHDLGDAAPAGSKPKSAKICYAITVTDPVDGGVGYAYLCDFDNPPAPSKTDYASYEVGPELMWMIGQTYKIGTGINESYFDIVNLRTPDGKWGPDIMDRYKTRGHGIPIPGKEMMPESNAKARAVAWIDGPVRVIRKSKGWLKVVWKIKLHGEGSSQNIYYPSWFVVPLRLGIPPIPKALLRNFYLTVTLDFARHIWGSKYYDPVNSQGVVIDGRMSDTEKNLDRTTSHNWYAIIGPKGSVMARYILPPNMKKWVTTPAYYIDDKNELDPPEQEPGQSNFGFIMKNFSDLPAGEYRYSAYFHFPKNLQWGEQDRILNILDKPLQVKISKMD